jgi:hypothetical protein
MFPGQQQLQMAQLRNFQQHQQMQQQQSCNSKRNDDEWANSHRKTLDSQ